MPLICFALGFVFAVTGRGSVHVIFPICMGRCGIGSRCFLWAASICSKAHVNSLGSCMILIFWWLLALIHSICFLFYRIFSVANWDSFTSGKWCTKFFPVTSHVVTKVYFLVITRAATRMFPVVSQVASEILLVASLVAISMFHIQSRVATDIFLLPLGLQLKYIYLQVGLQLSCKPSYNWLILRDMDTRSCQFVVRWIIGFIKICVRARFVACFGRVLLVVGLLFFIGYFWFPTGMCPLGLKPFSILCVACYFCNESSCVFVLFRDFACAVYCRFFLYIYIFI
jgi:hypothetical protein